MRREEELIWFLSLGLDGQEGLDKATAILRESLDWEYIISLAGLEGVTSLVYDRLKNNRLEQFVPEPILIRLESIYYTYSAQNALFYEELARVSAVLEQGSIPVIMFKGVFLAAGIYENIALRPMRDLDLLLKKEDVASAVNVLEKFGYQPIVAVEEQLNNPFNYSLTLSKGGVGIYNSVTVDLHWQILNSSWMMGLSSEKFDMRTVWANTETAVIAGIRMRLLSAEDLLISLSINAFNHCYERLILLADFAQVLKKYQDKIDWKTVHEKAKVCYLENILDYTLRFISEVPLSRPRPEFVFKRKYHYSRPLLGYILTKRGVIEKYKAFFRLSLVITRFLFKRLEHKKT
jgi:hypothetical protein